MFTNAKTVMINNKEVQSIITSNGGIIYKNWILDLTSDKQVIQTGEVATLSATLTHGGEEVSGETILFYDSDTPPIINTTNSAQYYDDVNLGNSFKLYYTPQSSMILYYCVLEDETNNISLALYGDGNVVLHINSSATTIFNTYSYIELKNGILYNGDGDSYDLSSYTLDFNLYEINHWGIVSFDNELIGYDVTDANGVASVSYTGKATGLLNIRAITPDGIIQSKTYSLIDAMFFDDGVSGTANWTNLDNNLIVTTGDEYTTLHPTVLSSRNRYIVSVDYIPSSPFVIEFDKHNSVTSGIYLICGANIQLASIYSGRLASANHLKFIFDDGKITVIHDTIEESQKITYTSISGCAFQFNNTNGDVGDLQFSNFKIYTIE